MRNLDQHQCFFPSRYVDDPLYVYNPRRYVDVNPLPRYIFGYSLGQIFWFVVAFFGLWHLVSNFFPYIFVFALGAGVMFFYMTISLTNAFSNYITIPVFEKIVRGISAVDNLTLLKFIAMFGKMLAPYEHLLGNLPGVDKKFNDIMQMAKNGDFANLGQYEDFGGGFTDHNSEFANAELRNYFNNPAMNNEDVCYGEGMGMCNGQQVLIPRSKMNITPVACPTRAAFTDANGDEIAQLQPGVWGKVPVSAATENESASSSEEDLSDLEDLGRLLDRANDARARKTNLANLPNNNAANTRDTSGTDPYRQVVRDGINDLGNKARQVGTGNRPGWTPNYVPAPLGRQVRFQANSKRPVVTLGGVTRSNVVVPTTATASAAVANGNATHYTPGIVPSTSATATTSGAGVTSGNHRRIWNFVPGCGNVWISTGSNRNTPFGAVSAATPSTTPSTASPENILRDLNAQTTPQTDRLENSPVDITRESDTSREGDTSHEGEVDDIPENDLTAYSQ